MGMFDYIRCELPLPATDLPPPELTFQTKDTPAQYLETYVITAEGRLVLDGKEVPDFHGDIEFGTISVHRGQWNGGDWDYRARFTNGTCEKIDLLAFAPPDPERTAKIEADWAEREARRAASTAPAGTTNPPAPG